MAQLSLKTKLGELSLRKRAGQAQERLIQGLPSLLRQRRQAIMVDRWTTGTQFNLDNSDDYGTPQGRPYIPANQDTFARSNGDGAHGGREFFDTATKSVNPFGRLVISSVAQTIFLEGARIRGADEGTQMDAFRVLKRNNWDRQQQAHTRANVAHGLAFVSVRPGKDPLTGADLPKVRAHSAKRCATFLDEEGDEWPSYALILGPGLVTDKGEPYRVIEYWDELGALQFTLTGYDLNTVEPGFVIEDTDKSLSFDGEMFSHSWGVTPIVPYFNHVDLEGNPTGEITPIIPILRRLDQDTFDRLVVQRFGAWKIRYIAGMAKPSTAAEERAQKLAMTAADILIAENPDTKFGTIDGTPTDGYISATDHDLRILAAVTQTPPHHLLGLSSNLQAEALAASEAGLQRKSLDYRLTNAGGHEQLLRLIALATNNAEEAGAEEIEIRWRDTESRSLEQAAQALGTLATQLHVPVELLWHRVPGWGDSDTERAKQLIEDGQADALIEAVTAAAAQQPGAAGQGAPSGPAAQ